MAHSLIKHLLILVFIFNIININANNIIGYLKYDDAPVSGGIVLLISENDSTIIYQSISDPSGKFSLEANESCDLCKISISASGYKHIELRSDEFISGSDIQLTKKDIALEEFVVSEKKPTLEFKNGIYIFDPRELADIAPNTKILLNYLPLVDANPITESYRILGEPVTFLINGRKPSINNSASLQSLNDIPTEKIEKVEMHIKPDPLVGYVRAVNIILKDERIGWQGNFTAGVNETYANINGTLSAYAGKYAKKYEFTIFAKPYYQKLISGQNIEYESLIDNFKYQEQEKTNSKFVGWEINPNLLFKFSPKSTLSVYIVASLRKNNATSDYKFQQEEANKINTIRERMPYSPTALTTVDYKYILDSKGSSISAKGNFYYYKYTSDYINNAVLDNYDLPSTVQDFNNQQHGEDFKLYWNKYFPNNISLRLGYEASNLHKKNILNSTIEDAGGEFVYNELLNSLNVNLMIPLKFGLTIDVSGNAVLSNVNFNYGNENREYHINDFYFDPSIDISYRFNNKIFNNITASYSLYTSRPYSNTLNPFYIQTDPYTYRQGNPYTNPQASQSMDMRLNFLQDFFLLASFSPKSTFITTINYIDNNNNEIQTSSADIENKSMYVGLRWRKSLFNRYWNPSINATFYRTWSNVLGNNPISYNHSKCEIYFSNNFTISKRQNISASLDYSFQSRQRNAYTSIIPTHNIDLGFSKYFGFKDSSMYISVYVTNLLNRKHYSKTISTNNGIKHQFPSRLQLGVYASLTYTFGNINFSPIYDFSDKSGLNK